MIAAIGYANPATLSRLNRRDCLIVTPKCCWSRRSLPRVLPFQGIRAHVLRPGRHSTFDVVIKCTHALHCVCEVACVLRVVETRLNQPLDLSVHHLVGDRAIVMFVHYED